MTPTSETPRPLRRRGGRQLRRGRPRDLAQRGRPRPQPRHRDREGGRPARVRPGRAPRAVAARAASPGRGRRAGPVQQRRPRHRTAHLREGRADVAVVSDQGNDRLRIYASTRHKPGAPLTDITEARPPSRSSPPTRPRSTTGAPRTASPPGRTRPPATPPALVSQRGADQLALVELTPTAGGTVGLPQGPHPGPSGVVPPARRHHVVPLRQAR